MNRDPFANNPVAARERDEKYCQEWYALVLQIARNWETSHPFAANAMVAGTLRFAAIIARGIGMQRRDWTRFAESIFADLEAGR